MSAFPSAASQAGELLLLVICSCPLAVLRAVSNTVVHGAPQRTKLASFPELKIPSVHLFIYYSTLFVSWINSLAWFTERLHGRARRRKRRVTMPSVCCINPDLVSGEKVYVSWDGWAKFRAPALVRSQVNHIQVCAVSPRACFSNLDCAIQPVPSCVGSMVGMGGWGAATREGFSFHPFFSSDVA